MLAPLWLTACAGRPMVVETTRTVEVAVPVPAKLEPELVKDCPPAVVYPAGEQLTFADVEARLAAVETALALCRGQLEKLRGLQRPK